jgi:hypothetical protein
VGHSNLVVLPLVVTLGLTNLLMQHRPLLQMVLWQKAAVAALVGLGPFLVVWLLMVLEILELAVNILAVVGMVGKKRVAAGM